MTVYMIGHARTYTYQPIRAKHCFRDVVSDVNLHLSLLLIPNIPLMLHHFLLVAVRTGAPPLYLDIRLPAAFPGWDWVDLGAADEAPDLRLYPTVMT